jgi:hypothetical protein
MTLMAHNHYGPAGTTWEVGEYGHDHVRLCVEVLDAQGTSGVVVPVVMVVVVTLRNTT